MSVIYIYEIPPIDHLWECLPTTAGYLQTVRDKIGLREWFQLRDEIKSFSLRSSDIAIKAGWEGDFREGCSPRVFFLPGDTCFEIGLVWKQDNNGTTFVASPRRLDYLNEVGQ